MVTAAEMCREDQVVFEAGVPMNLVETGSVAMSMRHAQCHGEETHQFYSEVDFSTLR